MGYTEWGMGHEVYDLFRSNKMDRWFLGTAYKLHCQCGLHDRHAETGPIRSEVISFCSHWIGRQLQLGGVVGSCDSAVALYGGQPQHGLCVVRCHRRLVFDLVFANFCGRMQPMASECLLHSTGQAVDAEAPSATSHVQSTLVLLPLRPHECWKMDGYSSSYCKRWIGNLGVHCIIPPPRRAEAGLGLRVRGHADSLFYTRLYCALPSCT